jgi:hypothetical protein
MASESLDEERGGFRRGAHDKNEGNQVIKGYTVSYFPASHLSSIYYLADRDQ